MPITVGDTLPASTLLKMGENGAEQVELGERLKGRKVVIFGLPGAFTGVCTTAHVPSFIRTKPAFDAMGVYDIICFSVNDPFFIMAWTVATGAEAAGLTTLADAESAFTTAIGMNFNAPPVGFVNRSRRYSLYAEDGVVKAINLEETPGTCEISAGETLLAQI